MAVFSISHPTGMRAWFIECLDSGRCYWTIVILVVAAYLALATASAMTGAPWWDEAWFASPALNLMTKGFMGTSVLDPSGWLKGVDQYTYWVMPLYLVTLAGWFKIVGYGLLSMRLLSALWGLVALSSWFFIMKALSRDKKVALLTLAFIALDYNFIMMASVGRMDMMGAALGYAAFAVYLSFRRRNFALAFVGGNALVAASAFTHPNGVFAFIGLFFLAFYFDLRHIKWRHLVEAAIPYMIGATGWGLYILQSPALFYTQFHGNASNRLTGIASPILALKEEAARYLQYYGFGPQFAGPHTGVWAVPDYHFTILILVGYGIAILGAIFNRDIRKHRGYRALLILIALYFLSLTLLDGHKRYYYLVYIIPMYAAIFAVGVRWCWQRRFVPAWMLVLSVCGFVSLNVGATINTIVSNGGQRHYMAVVNYLRHHSNEKTVIIGSAELAFKLGFNDHLVDDYTLGYYSGSRPGLIVIGRRYEEMYEHPEDPPAVSRYIKNRLTREFHQVYASGHYTIYAPRQRTSSPQKSTRHLNIPACSRCGLRESAAIKSNLATSSIR